MNDKLPPLWENVEMNLDAPRGHPGVDARATVALEL